jgi:DNA polymerase-1
VNPETGRIHTSFNQTVAATGRLSSSDPNLQNIPIRTEAGRRIRAGFVAAPGKVLVGADYSQIELRILAHVSGDADLVDSFKKGEDIHERTARQMFGLLPGMVTPDLRRQAKTINFGIVYGMSAYGLARQLGISNGEADRLIENYFARYGGVRAFLDATIERARSEKRVTTLFGRVRPVPEIDSPDRNVRGFAERVAINTPIQGTAADLIKRAMIAIHRRLPAEGLRRAMILQVHDELLFEVPEDAIDRATRLVREEMEAAGDLAVPLVVDVASGRSWADVH